MLIQYAKLVHKMMDFSPWHIFLMQFCSLGICIKAINLFSITYEILATIPEKGILTKIWQLYKYLEIWLPVLQFLILSNL